MKLLNKYKFLALISILFFSFTLYNCGGGGGDDGGGSGSAGNLSKINGRVTDVLAFNFKTDSTTYAKLKSLLEITKSAHAQNGPLAGITVIAVQIVGGEEIFVDEDVTDGDGSFSIDVPAGAIILQFLIGNEFFEILIDVPEDSTVEIAVSIDPDDPDNPVEISEMDVLDDVDDDNDDSNSGDEGQSGNDGNTGNTGQGGSQPGNNNNSGNQGGNNEGDDDDDSGQGENNDPPPPNNDPPPPPNNDPPPPPNNDPPPPPNNDPPPPTGGNGVTTPDMLSLINNVRSQGRNCGNQFFPSAPPVTWNNTIANSTLVHSEDMAFVLEDLSHTGSDGSSAGSRLTSQGYNWRAWGENIAFTGGSSGTAASAVNLWVNSPGHCSNIMNPNYTEMGASTAFGFFQDFQSNGDYWTLVLADSF